MKINRLNVTLTKEQVNALYVYLSKTSRADRTNALESGEWSEELDDELMQFWFSINDLRVAP